MKPVKGNSILCLLFVLTLSFGVLVACAGEAGKDGAAGAAGAAGKNLTATQPKLSGTFLADISPLFTKNDQFFEGALACGACHFAASAASLHELNLTSYNGILTGPDSVSAPPGEDLLGRPATCSSLLSVGTGCTPNWGDSALRARLRNTRMPPGWPFDLGEGNRDTTEILTIQAWLTDGAKQTGCTGTQVCYDTVLSTLRFAVSSTTDIDVGGAGTDATFLISEALTVGDLFKTVGAFFPNSQACTDCHGSLGYAWHELNMGSYAGILTGPDASTGGEDMLGRGVDCLDLTSVTGLCTPVWDSSALRARLRNTRMPPGWAFELAGTNRDDNSAINTIKAWVDAGAPNGAY
jgi:hypothetical protein